MALGSRPTVGTAAALLLDGSGGSATAPTTFVVKNPSSNTATVDLGNSGVTSGGGFQLAPGESVALDLINDQVYAIASAANTAVQVLALRV